MKKQYFIHTTASVSDEAKIAKGVKIWHQSQIREGASVGENTIIGKGVYIDKNIKIGKNSKIQNYASIYYKTTIEEGVFIGPYVCMTNDKYPRAVNPKMKIKKETNWKPGNTIIKKGAAIGAGVIVLPDIVIGKFAMIGAGSVVTKNVPDYTLYFGNPAVFQGYVCACGKLVKENLKIRKSSKVTCEKCKKRK